MSEIAALHYRRLGEGAGRTPVVILHGLFGSSDNWGSIGTELSKDFDVLLVDQRDHGRSPHTTHISYPNMAGDVHALIVALGLNNVVLVGHSMGGKTAMVFAQRWPDLLKHLVVLDISPREHEDNHAHIVDALRTADLSTNNRKDVEAHIKAHIKEPGVVQFILKNLHWKTPEQLAWRMNVEGLSRDLEHILASIGPETVRVPTLFIRGGQSDYITREDIPQIKEQFPNSRIETIDYAGHWVHAQAPQEVMEFIRSVS
ncbi:MAG: alpha/beta fold hydrolase [Flavobacteriales bacterium]|nr:alpha/beta fold hydrolase [Flavobacteriales bacterium]MBK7553059.1 alpha/beta fold hydrolase [Flavobacteriales bacterium]MBK9195947.1 alpha/beta fold hydrolase [Flavobacteriales bacterium]